jgi:hypothetical protein
MEPRNMNSYSACPVSSRLSVFAFSVALALGSGMPAQVVHAATVRNAEDLLIVDCLLPGQIRRLGTQAMFMSARRPIRTTQADCQIRGGEYVSYDRADYHTALKVWMESAMTGDPDAMNYVGEIYLKGLGTDPDYGMAREWFRKAADKGSNRAKINLGYMNEEGLGGPKDLPQALNLYREASGITNDELVFSSSVEVQLQAKDEQIGELRQTVASERATSEQLRGQVKELQQQLDQRQQALASSQHELNDTQSKLEAARKKTGADFSAVDKTRDEIVSNEDKLAEAQSDTKAADAAEIAKLKAQISNDRAKYQAQIKSMQARAPSGKGAKSKEDLELMKLLENQLLSKQTEVRDQSRAIASLQQRIGGGGNGSVALAGVATIDMINPPLTMTRGSRPAAVLRGAPGPHDLTGRVSSPQGVAQATVNGTPVALGKNGAFTAQVNVPAAGTNVQVVAIDKRGARATLDFTVLTQGSASSVASSGGTGGVGAVPSGVNLGRYYAVVIGNNSYQDSGYPTLQSATSDATAVAQVLKARYGYQTQLLLNSSRLEIMTALNDMREKLGPDDNLLIYYAGHGELQGRQGYWIPVDAKLNTPSTWISNAAISDQLNTMKSRHVLVVADSCYSGSLSRSAVPIFDTGAMSPDKWSAWVSKMASGHSRTALTSGGVQPVLDTGTGKHSYFTRAFLNVLQDNNRLLEAQRMFREVSSSMALAAIDSPIPQNPRYSPIAFAGHESGDFFFVPKGQRTADTVPAVQGIASL